MGFTERDIRKEERFLKENYPWLMKYYNEEDSCICIPEKIFARDDVVRRLVFSLISERTNTGRYVLFREQIVDDYGKLIPGYIVCMAEMV